MKVNRQLQVPIQYKNRALSTPLKLDILVENLVIIEVKSVSLYNKIFEAQALTYLCLMKLKLALVIKFGEKRVSEVIHRAVKGL